MAKKNKNARAAAKRSAKKHQKAVDRKREVAARSPTREPPSRPDLAWRPAREGIEGLARRMNLDIHSAASFADHMAGQHGRADASLAWVPARVQTLPTEEIVAALAERGVTIDRDALLAHSDRYQSARTLARELWVPLLPDTATVHDRDFLSQAAVTLWARWAPDRTSDEDLADLVDEAVLLLDVDRHNDAALRTITRAWRDAGGGTVGLARLEAIHPRDPLGPFVEVALAEIAGLSAEALADARDLLVPIAATTTDPETADFVRWMRDTVEFALGNGDSVVARFFEEAEVDPIELVDGGDFLLGAPRVTQDQIERVRLGIIERRPTMHGDDGEYADRIVEELALTLLPLASEPTDEPAPGR